MHPSRVVLLLSLLLALPVTALASDGVVYLSWDNCGGAGHQAEIFDCSTNSGTHTLVVSYLVFAPMDSLNGNEITIEMQTQGVGQVTPWWQVKNYAGAGGGAACRNGALSSSFDFTNGPIGCFDYWAGRASGGVGVIRDASQLNRQRILGVCASTFNQAGPLQANVETYSCRLEITNAMTIGAGSCGGCTEQATLVPTLFRATQNTGLPDRVITTTGAYAIWNPAPVPTRNRSWGSIKSMYR